MESSHWPLILIEGVLVFGGALAFGWWQLRSVRRDREQMLRDRQERERERQERELQMRELQVQELQGQDRESSKPDLGGQESDRSSRDR